MLRNKVTYINNASNGVMNKSFLHDTIIHEYILILVTNYIRKKWIMIILCFYLLALFFHCLVNLN